MSNSHRITSWTQLELRDLYHAYRKAKADCFHERTLHISEAFVEYERQLCSYLERLLRRLRAGEIESLLKENIGAAAVVAKCLARSPKQERNGPHAYFSDADRSFHYLADTHDLIPEFRLVGAFPVEMHILSGLWINRVGHLYDATLDSCAYGARLRRLRSDANKFSDVPPPYHLNALGSFEPYFTPYKRWRADGIEAMRAQLKSNQRIIAVSLDLKSFYHNVDAAFLNSDGFLSAIGLQLNPWEQGFSAAFGRTLTAWAEAASTLVRANIRLDTDSPQKIPGGVPIGLAAVRVMANALLQKWDSVVQRELSPVFYGRYVDDMFLVLRDPGHIHSSSDLMGMLSKRLECLKSDHNGASRRIDFGVAYQGQSQLILQDEKHKVFFLDGRSGADFLDSIEKEIAAVSSERRLMPNLDELENTAAARVLSASGKVGEEADSFRRAGGLTVRRLGWSVQLRIVETLARDLRPDDWHVQRTAFYEFARNHILGADQILDQIDYLPRLLSLAVALGDWSSAIGLTDYSFGSLERVKKTSMTSRPVVARINGIEIAANIEDIWKRFISRLKKDCQDAVLRAFPWRGNKPAQLTRDAAQLLERLEVIGSKDEIESRVQNLREHDWAKTAYKEHVRRYRAHFRVKETGEDILATSHPHLSDLREFLEESIGEGTKAGAMRRLRDPARRSTKTESLMPYLFPTRPYSTEEIALFVPNCISGEGAAQLWAKYVRAVRGVWVWPHVVDSEEHSQTLSRVARTSQTKNSFAKWRVGTPESPSSVRLGITSLHTSDETWAQAAGGKCDVGPKRYLAVGRLINEALRAYPRPQYLLLPELSLPERWLPTISGKLRDARINLIAGLDYEHQESKRIHSEAALVLNDDRLGYTTTVQIRQRKSKPAPEEEHLLQKTFGRHWANDDQPKRVYVHKGFSFGVLICSELQNIKYRQLFQGKVDALIVLSWNKDLETFSALVESAALDVHSYIALVNNRRFGDSRVRSPAKHSFDRDQCRLRGGRNDYLVIAEVDILALRKFQSRALNWPADSDPFKPVPEGFIIDGDRRVIPG